MAGLNVNRLTGLSSNMDTDTLIKNMMQIEQLKVNRELRARTTLEWKQTALLGVKTDLNDFRDAFFNLSAKSATNIKNTNAYIAFKTAVTGEGKDAVTVAASSTATAGSVTINEIRQLAAAAAVSSTRRGTGEDSLGISKNGQLSDSNQATLGSLAFDTPLQFENGQISFRINGKVFNFKETDTLQTMMSTVNNSDAGVVMNYSRLTDSFTISAKETGADGQLVIENLAGNAFGMNGVGGAFGIDEGTYNNGKNAMAVINGILVSRSSNTFSIDGISYTLNAVTDKESNVTLTKDIDKAVENIKGFVDGYNTLIRKLQSLLIDKKSSKEKSYVALTDEEKSAMSEKQIEEWETIAKKGLLYNDTAIRDMITSLRGALYASVEGAGLSAAEIGLQTGNFFTHVPGEIELNEDKLRAALDRDADQVMRVFMSTSTPTSADSAQAYRQNGLIARFEGIMDQYTKGTQAVTLENMERNLKDLTTKISNMEDKMARLEEKYYLKFSAMETAMAKLQSQSDSLVNMLSSSSK